MSSKVKYWKPGSWSEQRNVKQIPNYDDPEGLGTVKEKIRNSLPLVKYDEVVNLRNILKNIENGGGFFVQLGDCAESLSDFSETKLESYFKLFSEVQNILFSFLNKNVTIIGRMAGQFAKPRSELYEIINDELVITYRGDIINSTERTKKARSPDPLRMLWAYEQSFRTLELSKNFFRDGDFFSSHEALLLHYEESLVRKYKGRNVLTSTHLPWLGYRTCEIDGAHVEFLRGIINPIAIKIGKNTDFAKLRQIVSILNPENDRGKIILTSRFGVGNSAKFLAPIIEDMKSSRLNVIWCCDPMHGNTKKLENGLKTRNFCDILAEFREFSEVCGSANVYVGGIHIEATAEDVTECCDEEISLGDLNKNFKSLCDPRLNYRQSLELINKIKFVLS